MQRKEPFVHKLISKLAKVDQAAIEDYVLKQDMNVELLLACFREIPEGLIILDENSKVHYVNPNGSLFLGISESNKLHAKKAWDLIPDEHAAEFIKEACSKSNTYAVRDISVLSPKERCLRFSTSPINLSDNWYILLLLQDIGFQKKQEISRGELARIESLLRLAAGVAHEIGNPLNSIAIHINLLKKEIEGIKTGRIEKINQKLEVLEGETKRLDRIVRNFLKATRKPPLRIRMDDLTSVVDDALNFMRPEIDAAGYEVSYDPPDKKIIFLMDAERLREIIINLIKNAMEAMSGGGRICVSLSEKDHVATVKVKDEGCGIEEEHLPHIFDAYYTTKKEGSGLGLMTVFSGVREHGGRIDVKSKPGKGTEFSLLFPMRQPNLQLPDLSNEKSSNTQGVD